VKLPDTDEQYLARLAVTHEVSTEGGQLCVVLHDFPLAPGLSGERADILFRLPALYPDVAPDMWWISPALTTASGRAIPNTESHETYLGRTWQRWSRHLPAGAWNPSIDGLESWVAILVRELRSAADQVAA